MSSSACADIESCISSFLVVEVRHSGSLRTSTVPGQEAGQMAPVHEPFIGWPSQTVTEGNLVLTRSLGGHNSGMCILFGTSS
jgi:hypothetical protein